MASHPSLEQPTKKIKYLEKQMEIRGSPKIIEIAMLRDESATTSLQASPNSLRQLGQFGDRVEGGGGWWG